MSRYFVNHSYYFITVPTAYRYHFFDTFLKKNLILNQIKSAIGINKLKDFNFSIMSNHYHFVSFYNNAGIIPKILKHIYGVSAYRLNKITGNKKPVWGEYHVYLIESDILLSKVIGYVAGNPLKHKEVKTLKKLEKYPFSSYSSLIKIIGKGNIDNYIQSVIQITDEEFIKNNFGKSVRE
ncbi:MAG: transposase [Patescibacteria group bacterium]